MVLVRVAAFMAALPFFGSQAVPGSVKVWLTVAISLVLMPVVNAEKPQSDLASLITGLMGEALIGVTIGLGARLIFAAVELGGALIGLQLGFGLANVLDPTTQEQSSVIGQLQSLLATMVFFALNAHHFIFRSLVQSFELVPSFGFQMNGALMDRFVDLGGGMFLLGVKVGIPVMMALLLTQIAMGILARVVPQMNIFLFGFTLTIAVGLFMVGVSMPLFVEAVSDQFNRLDGVYWDLLTRMGGPVP